MKRKPLQKMNLPALFNSLSTRFSLLKTKMKIENTVNDYGLQLLLENTAIQILNTVYETNFTNSNQENTNSIAIDAIDAKNQTVLQITSTFSKPKIKSTLTKFLKSDLYATHKHLQFFFLKDIKTLSKTTQQEIETLCKENNLEFSIKSDFFSFETIYQKLYFDEPDIPKILKVIEIIDNVLGVLPSDKISGFSSIGISFEADEFTNVKTLVDGILKQGINVIISSKRLYKELRNHRFFDYLVLVNSESNLSYLQHYLIILSDQYIIKNLTFSENCNLLKTLLQNNCKGQILAFNPYLNNLNKIQNKKFRVYKNLNTSKTDIFEYSENLITSFLNTNTSKFKVNVENVRESLVRIRKGFEHEILLENKVQQTILFYIPKMRIEIVYVILKHRFSYASITSYIKKLTEKYPVENINLLVPQNPNHKTRKVLHSFQNALGMKNVYYIAEFLFEETLNEIHQLPILGVSDFVSPVIKQENNTIHLADILHWIVEESYPPIGIIAGPGGIGKTTLVEKIHDELIDEGHGHKHLVLFIEANTFIEHFRFTDFSDENEYDLYTIFKRCHSQGHHIDEQLFYNNFNYGNILMIIDGVDEIVSTITSFNLDSFLVKLSELENKIGKGKILLTSRNLYVKEIQKFLQKINTDTRQQNNPILLFDLMPFNQKLAEKYFLLNGVSEAKRKRGLSLLNELILDKDKTQEYIYPPFILDIVLDFMNYETDFSDDGSFYNTSYLLPNHRLDFIIQQTFHREGIKKHDYGYDLSIDGQTAFFVLMAIEKQGSVNEDEIEEIVNQIDFISNSEKIAKGLRDHPFIVYENNTHYSFIYSFLAAEFCVTGIFSFLKKHSFISLSSAFIRILAYRSNFESTIFRGILKKVKLDPYFNPDNFVEIVRGLIWEITNFKEELQFTEKKAISNLFLLLCEYYATIPSYKEDGFRQLISFIFGRDESVFISNFYLLDIPDNFLHILNFNGLNFKDSEIDNFHHFIFCTFNTHTSFESSCSIKNINIQGGSLFDKLDQISLTDINFDNVMGDNSLHKILRLKELGKGGIEKEIRKFLKSFYLGKTLQDKISEKTLKKNYNNSLLIAKITQEMQAQNIVMADKKAKKITINAKLKSKINKFVYQGRSFPEIRSVFKGIVEGMHSNE